VIFVGLSGTYSWLQPPLQTPLDPDEVVWVLDAEAYVHYINGNVEWFTLGTSLLMSTAILLPAVVEQFL
jgi:hypothetical protein